MVKGFAYVTNLKNVDSDIAENREHESNVEKANLPPLLSFEAS